jgi:hypothetical protein
MRNRRRGDNHHRYLINASYRCNSSSNAVTIYYDDDNNNNNNNRWTIYTGKINRKTIC